MFRNSPNPEIVINKMYSSIVRLYRESEKLGSLSSIGQKSMHPIADPTFCGGLLHNRNYSDSPQQRLDPLAPNPANQPGGPLLSSNEVLVSAI